MTPLPQFLQELEEKAGAATKVVAWYAHGGGDCYGKEATVRGPFCRWFKVVGPSKGHEKNVADDFADADYAAAAMNAVPRLIEIIRKQDEALTRIRADLSPSGTIAKEALSASARIAGGEEG